MSRLVYVGQDDDIADLAGRLQAANQGEEVVLIVPPAAQAFQTPLHLRLLGQLGARRGGRLVVVSPDARVQEQARSAGLTAFSSIPAYEEGVPVARRPGGAPPAAGPATQPPRAPGATGGMRAAAPTREGAGPVRPPLQAAVPAAASADLHPGLPGAHPAGAPPAAAGPWNVDGRPAPVAAAPSVPAPPGAPEPRSIPGPHEPWPAVAAFPVTGPRSFGAGAAGGGPGTALAPAPAPASPAAAPPGAGGTGGGPERSRPVPPGGRRTRTALTFVVIGVVVLGALIALALTPTATVAITIAEQPLTTNPTIQGGTAAPQPNQANYIQTRVVSTSASQQFTATPTGTKNIPAVAATGQVVITANGPLAFVYGQGSNGPLLFQTGSGVQFETTGPGSVFLTGPNYQSSPINVQALIPGSAGNVPQGAISQWANTPCPGSALCPPGSITVTNPSATSGGVDAQQQTVASASDVQGWINKVNQICSQLTAGTQATLAGKAAPDKLATDPSQNGVTVSCTPSPDVTQISPGSQASAQTVTVTMTAQAVAYNPADLEAVVYRDLLSSNNVNGPALPQGDQLVSTKPKLTNLQIIQAASDGTLALAVTGTDFYRPAATNLSSLRARLTGHTPGDVSGIVQSQISDVQGVTVSEHPFTLFFMPFFSSRITIQERFVASAAPAGS